jgi:DNA-binding NarL/FixJ family response regulator
VSGGGRSGEAGLPLSRVCVDRRLCARRIWSSLSPPTPTTVVLAHFDDLLAGGLRELIEGDLSLMILAADVAHDRISVVLAVHRPDVAILDLEALRTMAEVRELSALHPETRIVLLAGDPSEAQCVQLLAFGASACLGRDTQSRDVLHAIHLASRGLQVTPRSTPGAPLPSLVTQQRLTRREAEVLPLLAQNRSNAQIAVELQVGIETVRTHASSIYRKLGVSSRRELAAAPAPSAGLEAHPAAPPQRRRTGVSAAHARRGHGLRH